MKSPFKVIPAVYLVLKKDGTILLLRRHNTGYQDGNYSLIAGHIDGNESLTTALAREAQEEAGITIDPADLRFVHLMHLPSEIPNSTDDERVTIYFTTDRYKGTLCNEEPHKCDDLHWFADDALPKNIVPHVRYALENIGRGISYSEFGWQQSA